jgi:hypothetical protein
LQEATQVQRLLLLPDVQRDPVQGVQEEEEEVALSYQLPVISYQCGTGLRCPRKTTAANYILNFVLNYVQRVSGCS